MSTAALTPERQAQINGQAAINRGLRRYAEALSGPRKHIRRVLGPDVDEDYCFTDFLFALGQGNRKRLQKIYQAERTKGPLGEASGVFGGYLVPEDLRLDLMADVAENALIRPRAQVVPMQGPSLRLPLPDASTAQAAGTVSYLGGILMKWTSEGQTRPETEPQFREVDLKAWDLTGYALESNPLYQDGGAGLELWLRKLFAHSIAVYEDLAYLMGDGVGKPQGIIGATGAALITRSGSNAFTIADLNGMSQALLPISWERAIWVVSPTLWPKLTALNTSSWQINQPIPEGKQRPHFTLNGQAGFVSSMLPPLGTKGDVILFDPSLYVIGDRGAVEIAASMHEPTAFLKNQLVWRVSYRGDGQPQFSKTITLVDGTTVCSPYVVLLA